MISKSCPSDADPYAAVTNQFCGVRDQSPLWTHGTFWKAALYMLSELTVAHHSNTTICGSEGAGKIIVQSKLCGYTYCKRAGKKILPSSLSFLCLSNTPTERNETAIGEDQKF